MIVKFFTNGTGSSKGVFDYLLKDKEQPDGKRLGAEVLRGDIDNQAMLIDSLDFKQKYTSGCLSFTESADQVTEEQKNALMDGFEQTIRAGLGVDRVAVSWIEHRDKGRLELNFVYANVELKHGRAFQPYVHNVDKRRVNAWKDMQNIEHGFSDPSDPANKRLLGQRDNLPRDVKDARQAITEGLTALVQEGIITSRSDVVQSLTDSGFEIARQTDKAISIKNPDPESKRNIRLTGGLYERDFNFSAEVQSTVTAASEDYRARSTERYSAAKQLYDSEIARKRDYHQARHRKPKRQQRAATADIRQESTRYSYSPYNVYQESPSPYRPRFKQTRKRESDNDSELRTAHYTADRAKRERNSSNAQIRSQNLGMVGFRNSLGDTDTRLDFRSADSQKVLETDLYHSTTADTAADQLRAEVNHGQEITRASTASPKSTTGHDQTPTADARRQRQRYSRIDSIIDQASTSANTASRALTDIVRAVTEQDKRTDKRTEWLAQSSSDLYELNQTASRRVSKAVQHSNSASREHERVSECNSATRELKRQYGAVKEQIERFTESTDRTRELTNKNNKLADRNRDGTAGIRQVAEQIREVIKTQENQRQRYSAPRMGR